MAVDENHVAASTVSGALAQALARAGVKIAFTVPGESVLGVLEGLSARQVRVVAARHESSAAFMAEASAQLTGRVGVCVASGGPGAANLAAGLETAFADSTPLVAVVGQVARSVRGKEAFQEVDLVRTFEPIVKWAAEARDPEEVVALTERAVTAAVRGRPGPALLAVPEDVLDAALQGEADAADPNGQAARLELRPESHAAPDPMVVRKVLHLLADAERPLILAGAGVLRARCSDALARFAETLQIPVVSSWRRPDVFPNDNPLYLGMAGPGGPANVRARMEKADALLVLGCRLNESTSFGFSLPGAGARWAHVDLEPRGGWSGCKPEVVMATDAAAFLRVARRLLDGAALDAASFDARKEANGSDRLDLEASSVVDAEPWDGPGVHPGRVVATLARVLPPEAILTTDAGDFATWAVRGFRFHRPGTFVSPTSGAMGYALPAAIGAALVRPGRAAIALAGDGGFAMTMAELETAVRERAHVVAIVFDNGRYGMIWRHQAERGEHEGLATQLGAVDFAAIGNACGALGLTVESDEEFEPALRQALEAGRPALLHLRLDPRWTTPDATR
jgi:acetolactate synthase-1/2/3 large subunit